MTEKKLAEPKLVEPKEFQGFDDPFYPVLKSSQKLTLSDEQNMLIREVLAITSSDSQFAQKAYDALQRILTGALLPPSLTSLVPAEAEIGDASFVLHVHGTGFTTGSVINFAGRDEPTTFISSKEINTGVDMSVWHGADVLPVFVRNENGMLSNNLEFTFSVVEMKQEPVKTKSVESKSSEVKK